MAAPTFREAFRTWGYIGLNSFGGPAGQIAVMHRVLVEEKRWISEQRFLHALNYCMFLPGPEAQQLAVYVGWLLHKTKGGLAAGILFVLPGMLAMLALSILYATTHDLSLVAGLFLGLKPAVLSVVVEAVLRIGKRALKTRLHVALAALSFIGIFFFDVPFPAIVGGAALIGVLLGREKPSLLAGEFDERLPEHARPSTARALKVTIACLLLWFLPVLLLAGTPVFLDEGIFFSKTAVVTFGGAYAVLAYVGQRAVEHYGWLAPGEMLDGLGLAETTPGPLIMVLQFVGFLGAYRNPGSLDPMLAGVIGALLTTWVTFVPCFLWIFLGAPYIEKLRGNRALASALSAITAAVVGVILNLAVWFALHTLFAPGLSSIRWPELCIAVGAAIATFRFHLGMLPTLGLAAAVGAILALTGLS